MAQAERLERLGQPESVAELDRLLGAPLQASDPLREALGV